MITKEKAQEIQQRRNNIVNMLYAKQGQTMLTNDIANKLGVSAETVRRDLVDVIVPGNERIKQVVGAGFMCVKEPEKKEEKKPEIKRLDIFKVREKKESVPEKIETGKIGPKNKEGYPDPTASKAINSIPSYSFAAGEVWEYSRSDGGSDLFFVLSAFEDFYLGVKLSPVDKVKGTSKTYVEKVSLNDVMYTMDIRRIGVKLGKYCLGKIGEVNKKDTERICAAARGVLGMAKPEEEDPVVAAERWNALNKREQELDKREKALNAKELIFDPEFEKEKKELLAKKERLEALRKELLEQAEKMGADEQDLDEEKKKVLEEKKRLAAWEEELLAKEKAVGSVHVVETLNTPDNLEYALMKQKIEIYERLIFERGI